MLVLKDHFLHCGDCRTTMSQQRLNDLMILYIHKSETGSIDLSEIENEFVIVKEWRLRMLGKF